MSKSVSILLLGVGVMGQNHLRVLLKNKQVKVAGIYDTDTKKAEVIARKNRVPFYSSYEEAKNIDVSGVIVAIPTAFHLKVAMDFLKRNVPTLIEKPLASSPFEAEKIVKYVSKSKAIAGVGHTERFNPAVIELKKLMDREYFGKILSVNIKRVGFYPSRIMDTDVVYDLGVHDLDIICYLLGRKPRSLLAKGGGLINKKRIDHAEVFMDFGECSGYIQVNWTTPVKIRTLSITGSKGYAQVNYITQSIDVYEVIKKVGKIEKFKEFTSLYSQPIRKKIEFSKREPLELEIEEFVNAINGKKSLLVPPSDGAFAVKLAQCVLDSINSKSIIKL